MPERAPDFVYVVYIAANPDTVWNALMERDLTKAYWEHYNVSDWKQGSPWKHVRADENGEIDLVGTVIELDPPKRLVITWGLPSDPQDESRHSRAVQPQDPAGNRAYVAGRSLGRLKQPWRL
ncbi:MAG: hypothetical protein K0Q62_2218 [Phenylobacterium sp.]|nr:hypothetical protein [Phenylobacterium sp.]